MSELLRALPSPFDRGESFVQRDTSEYEALSRRNIEGFLGTARVPVGLAGPLPIHGEQAQGEFWAPLATTEGALVASTNRGMKVLREAGGVQTFLTRGATIQRAPVFEVSTVPEAVALARWIEEHHEDWKTIVATKTRFGRLESVRCFVLGELVHMRISLSPADAAGQNMVSIAAAAVTEKILEQRPEIRRAFMEGGFSGEKTPCEGSRLFGRGRSVVARAQVPGDILRQRLRAEPVDFVKLQTIYSDAALWMGIRSTHASLINTLTAMFIATGQDVASIPESTQAQNRFRYNSTEDTLEAEVLCPNLVLGTVGGGTSLPTQRECLELLGCTGEKGADKLAEICAAVALASELSFWGAILANEWVAAHAKTRAR